MKKWMKIVLIIIAAAIMIGVTVAVTPYILSLQHEENQEAFKDFVNSMGIWGPLAIFGIQLLQIFVAFVPGEPVEVLAGVMYGTFGGLFLCLAGIMLATVIIYFTVRKLGRKSIDKVIKKQESLKYDFIFKEKNINYLVFLLFFTPGIPKDVLIYLCPFTKIRPLDFFLIATFARIPSIITSTWAGSNLSEGDILKSVVIFAITGLVGLLGIFLHSKFIERKQHTKEIKKKED